MADIPVHRLEQRALRRLGRIEQVRALAPFPERADLNLWDSRADRYVHLMPAAVGGELGAVYMQIPEQDETPGAPIRIRAPASARSPRLSSSTRGVPEQLCYQLHLGDVGPHPNPSSVSTPPLPWPCRIVGANLQYLGTGATVLPAWGLWLTDNDYTRTFIEPTGEPLIQYFSDRAIPGVIDGQVTATTPVSIPVSTGTDVHELQSQAQALIGTLIREAGKRITFTGAGSAAEPVFLALTLTVQALAAERAAATFIPAAQRAPRPPAYSYRTRSTYKPPIPPTPEPGECVITPQTALQRLQLERNGEAWFRQRYRGTTACGFAPIFTEYFAGQPTTGPSLAVALQAIAAGRAAVTTPFRIGAGDAAFSTRQVEFESLRQIEARKALERAKAGPLVPVTGPLGGG